MLLIMLSRLDESEERRKFLGYGVHSNEHSYRYLLRTFAGNSSMAIMNGIGTAPIHPKNVIAAKHAGDTHSKPGRCE